MKWINPPPVLVGEFLSPQKPPTVPPNDSNNLIGSLRGRSGHGDRRKLKLHHNCAGKCSLSGSLISRRILFILQKRLPVCFKNKQWIKSELVEDVQYPSLLPFYLRSHVHEVLFQAFPILAVCMLKSAYACLPVIPLLRRPLSPLSLPPRLQWSPGYYLHLLRLPAPWDRTHVSCDNPDGFQITLHSNAVHMFLLHLECIARFHLWIRYLNKYFNYQIS